MASNATSKELVSSKYKIIKIAQGHPHRQRPQGTLVNKQHDLHYHPEALVVSPFGNLTDECPRGGKGDMDFAEGEHVTKGYDEWDPADCYDEVERRHRDKFRCEPGALRCERSCLYILSVECCFAPSSVDVASNIPSKAALIQGSSHDIHPATHRDSAQVP
ncbi:hypothetical protein V494_04778 [Pseudogymnoascus sp. VKM F-4513 (FW-928)]|nr:hypothetical protein V494_04778 [Pseudogymnoascus sp. VKM F-4513 (FW-928)]